jgi:hypothetical protein
MTEKINRGKLVRKYIGEGIAPFGFAYKGYEGDSWKFERQFKNVRQTISIYVYRFDPSMITFELYTSARGTGMVQAVNIEGVSTNGDIRGFWKYKDEEELIKVLTVMKDILVKKGMKILLELSKEDEIIATNEMYHRLYVCHDELCEKFIRKTGLEVTGYDEENINRWFDVIGERIKILKAAGYNTDTKEELIEIAAFLGNQLVTYLGGEWYHFVSKEHESCSVRNCKTLNGGTNCLSNIVGGYTENGMDWVKKIFLERYQNRL